MMLLRSLVLAVTLVPVSLGSGGDDWPKFQGPSGTGTGEVPGVNFEWAEDGPGVHWATPTGRGYGGASVRDGEVFLLDREVGVRDMLRVLDLETGEELWSVGYDAPGRLSFPGSRSVPTVTEKYVYTCGGFGQVYCFDREKQEVVWSLDMEDVYEGTQPTFGWSCSPLVVGDLVIVTPLGEFVGLLALDRFTGDEVWISEGVGFSHSTPTLLELNGEEQVLFLSTISPGTGQDQPGPMAISSYDPVDGTMLWRTEILLTRLPIPAPIKVDDEHIFLTGGYRGGSTLLKVEKKGREYAFDDVFHIDRGAQIQLPILYEDHLYVLVNENWNNDRGRRKEGGLLCLTLEGEELWRTGEEPFFGRGNAVLIGGHLVIQDGFNGVLRVARATPEGYQQVAEANVFGIDDRSDHEMWAPMAIAEGRLLVRSQEELLCVGLVD